VILLGIMDRIKGAWYGWKHGSAILRDPLTGAFDRRALEDLVSKIYAGCRRNEQSFAVAVLDVDGLKHINDKYGHSAGDKLLQYFAEIIGLCLRKSDLIVRYGGDEFLLVLPDTDHQGAEILLERLSQQAKKVRLNLGHGRWWVGIRFSFGVFAQVASRGPLLLESMIGEADERMYIQKEMGK